MVFGPDSPFLSQITRGRQTHAADFIQNLLDSCTGFDPGPELLAQGGNLSANSDMVGYLPQNIVASMITTPLITWAVIQIVSGKGTDIHASRLLHFEPKA